MHAYRQRALIDSYSSLRIFYRDVGQELTIDSDASAFQAALSLLRDSGKRYELVWFGHTKGATNPDSHALRQDVISSFLEERRRIERAFLHDANLGSYGHWITIGEGATDQVLDRFFRFKASRSGPYFLHTFYVIRGSIIAEFLTACAPEFFAENLISGLGLDRYFFERDFPAIAEKMGYGLEFDHAIRHPYFNNPVDADVMSAFKSTRNRLSAP